MNTLKLKLPVTLHLLLIIALGFLVYSNVLSGTFQFDDKLNIVDNPLIRDIGNMWPPSGSRWFGNLTFSLNYIAGGLNPTGYHIVNISIHIFTALTVYMFVFLTLNSPFFTEREYGSTHTPWVACICSLLFVVHPIQTQAVTYIVQRFTSLAALLFMLSLNSYILARLSTLNTSNICQSDPIGKLWPSAFFYTSAGLCALLSFKTKENAYTLPAIIAMYDVMFISGLSTLASFIKNKWRLIAILSTLTSGLLAFTVISGMLPALFNTLKATNEISRHDYLITQFRVIITYIRLLFIPVGQTIDHHYPIYHTVFEPAVFLSLMALLLLLFLALYLFWISRNSNKYLRLASFGIFWFFVTLSVESSFIPIPDVMFEHRVYLPSIGVILAVVSATAWIFEKQNWRSTLGKTASGSVIAVTLLLSYATYDRNKVWNTELTLWTDAIEKKPKNPRAYNMVGGYYQINFRVHDAITFYKKALDVDNTYMGARSNLANAYVLTGRIDEGLNELLITANSHRFDAIDTAILLYNIGKAYNLKGMPDHAIEYLNYAIINNPNDAAIYFLLGHIYKRKNLLDQSSMNYKKAHELAPDRY